MAYSCFTLYKYNTLGHTDLSGTSKTNFIHRGPERFYSESVEVDELLAESKCRSWQFSCKLPQQDSINYWLKDSYVGTYWIGNVTRDSDSLSAQETYYSITGPLGVKQHYAMFVPFILFIKCLQCHFFW